LLRCVLRVSPLRAPAGAPAGCGGARTKRLRAQLATKCGSRGTGAEASAHDPHAGPLERANRTAQAPAGCAPPPPRSPEPPGAPAESSVPIVSRPRATSWGALGTARASVAAATSDAAPATVSHARVTPATGAATPATRSLALPGAGSHAAGGRAGVARGGVA